MYPYEALYIEPLESRLHHYGQMQCWEHMLPGSNAIITLIPKYESLGAFYKIPP